MIQDQAVFISFPSRAVCLLLTVSAKLWDRFEWSPTWDPRYLLQDVKVSSFGLLHQLSVPHIALFGRVDGIVQHMLSVVGLREACTDGSFCNEPTLHRKKIMNGP